MEKWRKRLPVVYMRRKDWEALLEVSVKLEKVDDVDVIFLWFKYLYDYDLPRLPFFDFLTKPEHEPLAIAYHGENAFRVYSRPHYRLKAHTPVRHNGVPVVYISPVGHAPRTSWFWVMLSSYDPRFKRFDISAKVVEGYPESADTLLGRSFRQFVLEDLRKRPRRHKNTGAPLLRRMLRFLYHSLKAYNAVMRRDPRSAHRALVKAFLTMPPHLKRTWMTDILLKEMATLKYLAKSGMRIPEKYAAAWKETSTTAIIETIALLLNPKEMRDNNLQAELLRRYYDTYRRVDDSLYEDGEAPEADVYEGVSFRQFIRDVLLTRPENNKNSQRHREWGSRLMSGLVLAAIMPRTVLRLFLAGRSSGKGDLKGAYKHAMKAYSSMPKRFRSTYFGDWLLDNIEGLKRIIEENTPLTDDELRHIKNKFCWAVFADAPSIILAAITNDEEKNNRQLL